MWIKPAAVAGAFVASVALVSSLSGCSGQDGSDSGRPDVVASFYPLAFVAEQVGGEHVTIHNLTTPGVEPHDLELKPKQIGLVQDADLVVYESGFQAAVDQAVDQADSGSDHLVDAAEVSNQRDQDESDRGGDHSDHSDHGSGHAGASIDPHVWLDPRNMIAITESVADRLAALDRPHAAAYRKNAESLVRKLTRLDKAFRDGLRDCSTRQIVTTHDAFGYLAAAYHLEQVPIAGIDPSNEPSAEQLADIAETARRGNVGTIFTEELVSPRIAQTIADETGATTATLNPVEGLSDSTANETYLSLMRENLRAIQKANGCS